jgi:hypothetical protein
MASISVVKLKIRRGTNSERLQIVLDNGELGYTTDFNSKRVFIGDGVTYGGIPVGSKFFVADISSYFNYSKSQVGDIIYDPVTSVLYSVSSIDTSTPEPYPFEFAQIARVTKVDNSTVQFNGAGQLQVINNSIGASKIASSSFNQSISGGNGQSIGVNYDNNKITISAGKLTVNEASLNLSLLDGSTLPSVLPGTPGKLYNAGGFVKVT